MDPILFLILLSVFRIFWRLRPELELDELIRVAISLEKSKHTALYSLHKFRKFKVAVISSATIMAGVIMLLLYVASFFDTLLSPMVPMLMVAIIKLPLNFLI
jgi:hypothetical protein